MQHMHEVLTTSVRTTGLFEAYDTIGFDGAKTTTDDAPVLGIAKHPSTVIGDYIAVSPICITRVRAVGAILAGAKLITAAAGGVQTAGAEAVNVFATALTPAADGGFVDILVR